MTSHNLNFYFIYFGPPHCLFQIRGDLLLLLFFYSFFSFFFSSPLGFKKAKVLGLRVKYFNCKQKNMSQNGTKKLRYYDMIKFTLPPG
jgi:hypothetical protein